jgi:hypothetical protein
MFYENRSLMGIEENILRVDVAGSKVSRLRNPLYLKLKDLNPHLFLKKNNINYLGLHVM